MKKKEEIIPEDSNTYMKDSNSNINPNESKEVEVRKFVLKPPFPQNLKYNRKEAQFEEIQKVFKEIHINIPFLDAIKQVPSYGKFLKDLVTQKRKTNVPKKVFLAEQASSIIQ